MAFLVINQNFCLSSPCFKINVDWMIHNVLSVQLSASCLRLFVFSHYRGNRSFLLFLSQPALTYCTYVLHTTHKYSQYMCCSKDYMYCSEYWERHWCGFSGAYLSSRSFRIFCFSSLLHWKMMSHKATQGLT